jgi:membrane fusion protein, heavy metal efflux system
MIGSNVLPRAGVLAILVALGTGGCSRGVPEAGNEETATGNGTEQAAESNPRGDTGTAGVVTLSEAAMRTAGIETAPAADRTVSGLETTAAVPGQVEFDPARVALISPRLAGRIERLTVVEGDPVRAGQAVVEILSTAFLTAQHDLIQAVRRARLLEGSADAEGAAALADAARQRLRLMGAGGPLIDSIVDEGRPRDVLPIGAPFNGRITQAHALSGAAVEAGSPIFTLADLSIVNVAASVPERSIRDVRIGQPVTVTLAAYPDRRWDGKVVRIKAELDRETRTAVALIQVANEDGSMRPGMFASIRLGNVAGSRSASSALAIPASAIVTDGEERYVFVEIGERSYERRIVDVSQIAGGDGSFAVHSGLAAGERVVIRGAFTLKAELAKATFGEH